MDHSEICWMTATELAKRLRARDFSASEVARAHLDRITALNPKLEAYIMVTAEHALQAAQRVDEEVASQGFRGPLHGVPYSLKDVFWTKGVRTTAGSKILAAHIPTEDSTAGIRMDRAGGVLVGKVNCHEFAYGVTTQNTYASTRNPWDITRIPGGSSGGSGAAVAAGLGPISLGSDTAGSIRIPAALCGAVGLKPTYGRVSCHGVFAQSFTSDHAGPLARSVEDVAAILQIIAGYDPRDPTTSREPVPDYCTGLGEGIRGLRIGVPAELFDIALEPGVEAAFRTTRQVLADLGAEVSNISIPALAKAQSVSSSIVMPETTARHEAWLATRPQDYGEDVRALLTRTTGTSASQYIRAAVERRQLRFDLDKTLSEQVDLLLTPGVPVSAPEIGQETIITANRDMDLIDAMVYFFSPFSITGLPALVIPAGLDERGLPAGIQIVGRAFDEATVLRAGYAFEQATGWTRQHPALA